MLPAGPGVQGHLIIPASPSLGRWLGRVQAGHVCHAGLSLCGVHGWSRGSVCMWPWPPGPQTSSVGPLSNEGISLWVSISCTGRRKGSAPPWASRWAMAGRVFPLQGRTPQSCANEVSRATCVATLSQASVPVPVWACVDGVLCPLLSLLGHLSTWTSVVLGTRPGVGHRWAPCHLPTHLGAGLRAEGAEPKPRPP